MTLQEEIDCKVYGDCSSPTVHDASYGSPALLFLFSCYLLLKIIPFVIHSTSIAIIFFMFRFSILFFVWFFDYPFVVFMSFLLVEFLYLFIFLARLVKRIYRIRRRPADFVPALMPISEFDRLSVLFTRESLAELRSFVRSPACNKFDLALRLRRFQEFARAIEFDEMLPSEGNNQFSDTSSSASSTSLESSSSCEYFSFDE